MLNKFKNLSLEDQIYVVNLPYHLAQAGMTNELYDVLTEFDFLEYKVSISGIRELVDDYDFALQATQYGLEKKSGLKLVQRALQLSTHILNEDRTQLAGQLLGRLLSYEVPTIQKLIEQAKSKKNFPWFCPLGPILRSPDIPLLKTLVAHTEGVGGVNSIILTQDGRHLISAGQNIKIWEIESGRLLQTLRGHSQQINSIALTPDNKHLVSASSDETLKVWDLDSGREFMTLEKHSGPVSAVVVTPDGHYAISAARFFGPRVEDYEPHDNPLIVWCLETGEKVMLLHGHLHSVVALAITPDGQRVVSAEGENLGEYSTIKNYVVRVWDLKNGRELVSLHNQPSPIKTVKVTPNGQCIISAIDSEAGFAAPLDRPHHSGILKAWDIEDGSELLTLSSNVIEDTDSDTYRVGVNDFIFLSEGKRIVSFDTNHQVRVWDMENGVELNGFFLESDGWIRNLVITPDENYLITASSNGTIKFWDWLQLNKFKSIASKDNTQSGLVTAHLNAKPVTSITITPDGKKAISASNEEQKRYGI